MALARTLRWQIMLPAYKFKIVHKKGSSPGNADALSCLPMKSYQDVEWRYDDLFPESKEKVKLLVEDIATSPSGSTRN